MTIRPAVWAVARRIAVAAVLAAATTSGCAAQPGGTATGGHAGGNAARHPADGGQSATSLAGRVPGCAATAIRTRAALASTAPRLARHPQVFAAASSAAACTLRGNTAILFSFPTRDRLSEASTVLHRIDTFYTVGGDWAAAPAGVTASAVEESISQEYALALHGRMTEGNPGR